MTYSPKLTTRIRIVLKRACGMKPPRRPDTSRWTARGPTVSLQYGQMRSLVVINARQCGHIRRESISIHSTTSRNSRPFTAEAPRRREEPVWGAEQAED